MLGEGLPAIGSNRDQGSRIDPKDAHDILSNGRRRKVLKRLSSRIEPVDLRDLAEHIAVVETGESPPPRAARQSVYNSLYQTHLPKLDEMGVIDYDADRKKISLRYPARQVDLYMEIVTRYGITWTQYYRTLGVIALMTIVAANTGIVFFSEVPTLAFTSLFLAIFAVSTAYQLWSRRWFYLRSLLSSE